MCVYQQIFPPESVFQWKSFLSTNYSLLSDKSLTAVFQEILALKVFNLYRLYKKNVHIFLT